MVGQEERKMTEGKTGVGEMETAPDSERLWELLEIHYTPKHAVG